MTVHPRAAIAALAEEQRLAAFALIVLAPRTATVVADELGVTPKVAGKLLARLESVGLAVHDGDQWSAHAGLLRGLLADDPSADSYDSGVQDPAAAAVLRAFLPHGRLEQIPAARRKRLVVLDHVAMVFEPGMRYAESEVNVLLKAFHADYAALRRYLVDEGFLARESGTYWRSGGTVDGIDV